MKKTRMPMVVDPLRSEAIALTDALKDDLRVVSQTFWDIGDKLRRVREQKLYAALTYDDFASYVEAELGVQVRQALKMLRVVRHYARADAAQVGLERAAALIRLCKARGGRIEPGALVRENAEIAPGVTVLGATVAQIDGVAQSVKEARSLKRKRSPRARAEARSASAAIGALRTLMAKAGFPRVHITLRDGDAHVVLPRTRVARLGR